jgi:hypothetical protein
MQALLGIAVLVATVGIAAALPDRERSLDNLARRAAEVVRVLPPWTSVSERRFCDDSLAPPSLLLGVSEQERQELLPRGLTDLGWTRVEDQSPEDDHVEVVGFERSMDGWTAELGWIVVEERPVSALGWSVVEERPATAETVVSVVLADGPPDAC